MENEALYLALTVATVTFLLLSTGFVAFVIFFIRAKNAAFEEKKAAELNHLNLLMEAEQEIQENTLSYVGRELHDNLGQLLVVAKMYQAAAIKEQTHPKAVEAFDILSQAIGELRTISNSLNTDRFRDLGLIKALEIEFDRLQRMKQLEAVLLIESGYQSPGIDTELILFRITQEFIANTLKYANASTLSCELNGSEGELELVLTDDGQGFNISEIKEGNGLRNMRHRATAINADIKLEAKVDQGCTMILKLKT